MSEALAGPSGQLAPGQPVYDFYLGLDFGTTRTNASWLKKRRDDDSWVADVLEVDDVGGWNPDFNSQPRQPGRQVPSQSLYVRRPDEPGDVYYGYEALSRASDPSDELVTPVHIIDAKPVDGYPAPGTSRKLEKLKTWGMIEQDDDVEINYMTWTLLHVKRVLTEDQGMTPHSRVQIYIGCPVAWNQSDRRRFRSNVAKAARRADIGSTYRRHQGSAVERNDGTVDYDVHVSDDMQGVTVITETEAAGLYLILTSKMRDLAILPGSTIVAGDIGGGTSDFSSFGLSEGQEHRIEEQKCPSSGCPDGMQKLNENLRRFARERLSGHPDLERPGVNLDDIIEKDIVQEFEDKVKPSFRRGGPTYFRTVLGTSAPHGVTSQWNFVVSEIDMWEQVFLPVFEAIATKLREQLRFARQKDPNASSIWLYGGGADQPMLRPYLQQHVIDRENQGAAVRWILNGKAKYDLSGTFVSKGAALAAASPAYLPKRYYSTSYGIVQNIPCGPGQDLTMEDARRRGPVEQLDIDGEWYLLKAARYFIKSGETYGPTTTFDPIEQVYSFHDDQREWREDLAVVLRDGEVAQDYPLLHEHNEGHQVVDVLRSQDLKPLLQPCLKRPERVSFQRKKRMLYYVHSKVQPKMRGLDLVLDVQFTSGSFEGDIECRKVPCTRRDPIPRAKVGEPCPVCQLPVGMLFQTEIDVSTAFPLGRAFDSPAPATSGGTHRARATVLTGAGASRSRNARKRSRVHSNGAARRLTRPDLHADTLDAPAFRTRGNLPSNASSSSGDYIPNAET